MHDRTDGHPRPTHTKLNFCVYCGSGKGTDPAYAEAARTLGAELAAHGIGLVYGGGSLGLMGEVARATLAAGGRVTGIIPTFLSGPEQALKECDELLVVADMHQRKYQMFQRSDAFIALPGGVGTLEEFVEQLTWSQIGHHAKPKLIVNTRGYWQPLLDLLRHMERNAFIRPEIPARYLVVDEAREAVPAILAELARQAAAATPQLPTVAPEQL